ncbi:MAG: M48 family metallopeptidase [Ruminococcus sp.]|nr:M48 family metallopeptidase [Ruminococcus sp.]
MQSGKRRLVLDDGTVLDYTVDRSKRRNIYIAIKGGKVVLRLPLGADEERGTAFLREKAAWVLKGLASRRSTAVVPEIFAEGERFTLAGEEYEIVCEEARRYFAPRFEGGSLVVSVFGTLEGDARTEYTDAQVRKALKKRTSELIASAFTRLTALTGLCPKKVTVKKMSASWGRCSSSGNISINSRVVFFPQECIDYVVIHELCHLRYMDHSPQFWALVSSFCPDWKRIRESMN